MMLPENELPLFERPAAATDIYIYTIAQLPWSVI